MHMRASRVTLSVMTGFIAGTVMQLATSMASPVTYDYTATANSGPLSGDVFSGTFVVNSAAVASGSGNVSNLTLDIFGTPVTQSEGVFGLVPSATFASDGSLTNLANFVIISTARAAYVGLSGGIFLPSPMTSFNFDGAFNYGADPTHGENYGGGAFAGSPVTSVPEPGAWVLFGIGMAGMALLSGRRPRYKIA